MKLGQHFLSQGVARQAPVQPVQFRAIFHNGSHEQLVADARAVLSFVDEATRAACVQRANARLVASYRDAPIPTKVRSDEEIYEMLAEALRDSDDPRQPFCDADDKVGQLKQCCTLPVVNELWTQYQLYVEREFPAAVDDETFQKLVEEAKRVFFPDLLSRYGYATIRASLPSLAAALGK